MNQPACRNQEHVFCRYLAFGLKLVSSNSTRRDFDEGQTKATSASYLSSKSKSHPTACNRAMLHHQSNSLYAADCTVVVLLAFVPNSVHVGRETGTRKWKHGSLANGWKMAKCKTTKTRSFDTARMAAPRSLKRTYKPMLYAIVSLNCCPLTPGMNARGRTC